MQKTGHSEEQILRASHQAESGTTVPGDLPRIWDQRRYSLYLEEEVCGPGLELITRIAPVARGKPKLKRLVADLARDRHVLQEIVQKKP
jgi:hypothetical protein